MPPHFIHSARLPTAHVPAASDLDGDCTMLKASLQEWDCSAQTHWAAGESQELQGAEQRRGLSVHGTFVLLPSGSQF